MKYIQSAILSIGLMAIYGAVMAQNAAADRGLRNFKRFDFAAAAGNYETAVKKAPNDISLKEKLARTYVILEDHAAAEAVYAQIVKIPASQAINKLYYGLELRANGKYDEAAKAFNEYAKILPDDKRAKELTGWADKMKALAVDNKIYEIANLQAVNSPASEIGAAYYKDGLMFSSNRGADAAVLHEDAWSGHRFYNLYSSKVDQGGNAYPPVKVNGKRLNRRFHEGPSVVSADGKELFFTRSNYIRQRVQISKDNYVKLKIMHADWDENKQRWTNIKEISIDNNEYSVADPALSKDGKRLFFTSDMPGGLGETDIYVSYRGANDNWGPAINLGPEVNTPGREMFPYMAADGTLYFSSDSRVGLGGLDVYSSTFGNGEWANTQNLGAPINSQYDDFGFIIDGNNDRGYMVSNRPGGQGEDDIYTLKKNGLSLCGTVVDAMSKAPLPAGQVKLYEGDVAVATKATGDKGEFCFTVMPNKHYMLTGSERDYEPSSVSVSSGMSNQVTQIGLSKLGGLDLSVCVKQSGKGTLEGAEVEITNKATGDRKSCTIGSECKCKFDLEANSDYSICAYKESSNTKGSYDKPCKSITTRGKVAPASIYETLEMTYLEENMTIKLDNLYYDLGKWNIRPDAAVELNKLLEIMNKFPHMEIELSSHTDCRGSMKANDELSAKRAQACVDYLIANGIDSKRMVAVGYGERKLVNGCACEGNVRSNCSEEQHQQNRRTEFKILKLK